MQTKTYYDKRAVLKTFQVMFAIEMEVSCLYSIFAKQFPEERVFWKKISDDEIVHADNIKRILKLISQNNLTYRIGKSFSYKAGILILEHIKLYVSDANEKLLSKADTFLIALELESTILESKYMDYLITDNKEYNDFLKTIDIETLQHRFLVKKKYKDNAPKI